MKQRIPEFDEFIYENKKTEKVYKSKLDNAFTVTIIYPASELYSQIKQIILDDGIAVTNMAQKAILMDGGKIEEQHLSKDHVKFIEMHEIAHSYLEHQGTFGILEQEKEADFAAYLLLVKKNMKKAANLVIDYFDTRHGENFDDFKERSGEHVKDRLKKYLK